VPSPGTGTPSTWSEPSERNRRKRNQPHLHTHSPAKAVALEAWRFSPRASEAGERAERTTVREHARRWDREAIGEKRQASTPGF